MEESNWRAEINHKRHLTLMTHYKVMRIRDGEVDDETPHVELGFLMKGHVGA